MDCGLLSWRQDSLDGFKYHRVTGRIAIMEIQELYKKFLTSGKVSTDTRQIAAGSIFFALKGDRFNANELVSQALEKGASYAVMDEARYASDDRCIVVANTLETLQALARYHRAQ